MFLVYKGMKKGFWKIQRIFKVYSFLFSFDILILPT